MSKHYDVVIIGGGQAALAMGYFLAQRGVDFIILDAAQRTGDAWRQRWDSLTLFTPARYSSLPGMTFPAAPEHMPHKDEVANYLERYANHFALPIEFNEKVIRLEHISEWRGFAVITERGRYEADEVVVATGAFQQPVIPAISHAVGKRVQQLHSTQYKSPAQLPPGDVVVVGGGNSGVQIASELAATRRTWLSVGEKLPTLPSRFMKRSIFWWLESLGAMQLSVDTRLGERASKREFLIGKSAQASAREDGVQLIGRAVAAEGDLLFMSDGAVMQPAAIIWATGFRSDFTWIEAPVFDSSCRPVHKRGVSMVSGLYFLGMPWQHTRGSSLIGWVGRDAEFLSRRIGR